MVKRRSAFKKRTRSGDRHGELGFGFLRGRPNSIPSKTRSDRIRFFGLENAGSAFGQRAAQRAFTYPVRGRPRRKTAGFSKAAKGGRAIIFFIFRNSRPETITATFARCMRSADAAHDEVFVKNQYPRIVLGSFGGRSSMVDPPARANSQLDIEGAHNNVWVTPGANTGAGAQREYSQHL